MSKPLEVLPYDGVFRCHVRSEKSKRLYLVDLEAWNGVGFCGCIDFATRKQPEIERLSPKERIASGSKYRCKHIKAARALRAEQFLNEIINQRAEKARLANFTRTRPKPSEATSETTGT